MVPTPQTARERAADRERLVDVTARLQALDSERSLRSQNAVKKLLETEQDLLYDRLSAYIYPVLTLPPEIVSEIFVHFLPVYPRRAPRKGRYSPVVLTQICRLWREIAVSTPRLWRTFKIFLRWSADDDADQVRALERSGSCPLSVHLASLATEPAPPILHKLMAHKNRWEHLKLAVYTPNLSAIVGPFPLLHTLTAVVWLMGRQAITHRSTAFRDAPLLRRVTLAGYEEIFRDMLPWAQLTVLVIEHIAETQCLRILALAPHLVYCDLTLRLVGENDAPSHVSLTQLKTLKFRTSVYHPHPTMLATFSLQVPALQRLHIYEALLTPDPVVTLRTLLLRWNCSPQEIRIAFPEHSIDIYSEALPSVLISSTHRFPVMIEWLPPETGSTNLGPEAANIHEDVWTSDSENASDSDEEEE
ncbi:hypothetical protein C8R46DRAFT_1346390 [Mycena filopes]|nr:hypothetical protein C8R46DRAFT_1346390 [Mycena filopes]